MKLKYNTLLFILPLLLVMSCSQSVEYKSIYFAGQIVNPKEKSLEIFQNERSISTSKLNRNNNFEFKLDSLTEGLYTFKHGVEYQYLFLEPNDSVVMRLNTWDFDESLVFSGRGAAKNNFLIQLFLKNEKEKKLFHSYYKLEEVDFSRKIDSLITIKLNHYKKFKENIVVSSKFESLVQTAIYYPIYSIKEKYAHNYKVYHRLEKSKKLSDYFYAYRQNTDINDIQFLNYYAFNRYVGDYLLNISDEIHEKDTSKQLSTIILKQINSKIKNEKLKNNMLHHAIINCLLDKKCCDKDKKEVKNIFYTNCTDKEKVADVNKIVKSLAQLKKYSRFPSLDAIDYQNKKIELDDLKSDKKMVLYFWPKEANRIQYLAKRVNYLAKEYPNFRFIGLDNQLKKYKWKKYIKKYNFNKKNQFQLVDTTKNKWFTNQFPRAIILNKKGIIQNDFSYLSHHNFEKILAKIEKYK